MGKRIEFEFDGKTYKLEFSKYTVKQAEEEGFSLAKLDDKPLNMLEILFRCAFYKNHKSIQYRPELAQEIYETLDNKESLLTALMELYSEPVNQLMAGEGKTKWKTVG